VYIAIKKKRKALEIRRS